MDGQTGWPRREGRGKGGAPCPHAPRLRTSTPVVACVDNCGVVAFRREKEPRIEAVHASLCQSPRLGRQTATQSKVEPSSVYCAVSTRSTSTTLDGYSGEEDTQDAASREGRRIFQDRSRSPVSIYFCELGNYLLV